jgi:hypothetical protein
MKYLKYIFENEDVRALTESNEADIELVINENIEPFMLTNFKYIVENINDFVDSTDLDKSFNNIKSFIAHDLAVLLSAISEVAALDESFEHVHAVMDENVSTTFFGIGYGAQKVQRLITSTYI